MRRAIDFEIILGHVFPPFIKKSAVPRLPPRFFSLRTQECCGTVCSETGGCIKKPENEFLLKWILNVVEERKMGIIFWEFCIRYYRKLLSSILRRIWKPTMHLVFYIIRLWKENMQISREEIIHKYLFYFSSNILLTI